MPDHDKTNGWSARRFLLYIIIAGIILYILEEAFQYGFGDVFNKDNLTDYLQDNMEWAWVIILLLWLIQAVLAPLPAPLLIMVTSVLYADSTAGVIFAIVLTWCGAMLGAVVCFGLSRHFGRDWVMKKGYMDKMKDLDLYLEEKGSVVIFLTRLIPIISFDVVSYAAGLTKVRWKSFIAATGLGMIPTNVIFILFAAEAISQDMTGLYIISFVGIIMLALASYLLVWLMNDYEAWIKDLSEQVKGDVKE